MGWLLALIIGGLVGWLMSYSVKSARSTLFGILTGAIGGIAGPLFFGNLIGLAGSLNMTLGSINFLGFLWSLIGAVVIAGATIGAFSWPMISSRREGRTYAEEIRKREDRDKRD